MAVNTKPTLSSIACFDAEFGMEGKEDVPAPVLVFSWRDGSARQNRIVIRDYDSNEVVYDCTLTTMALKHQLHNSKDTAIRQTDVAYALENGHKYIANVYVFTEIGGESSLASNDVIFYCYSTPTFEFINFESYVNDSVALVTANSVNLRVSYVQDEGEVLYSYKFILKDYNGTTLLESDTEYSSESEDVLRYTLGGVDETDKDSTGTIQYNQSYTIYCEGETAHGMVISTSQAFVVRLDNSGVGASVYAENVGDGTVSIVSNFKLVGMEYSGEEEVYLYDENGDAYAIDLTDGDTLTYGDSFIMTEPYEIVLKGSDFNLGTIITFSNTSGGTVTVSCCQYKFLDNTYYFALTVENLAYKENLLTGYRIELIPELLSL